MILDLVITSSRDMGLTVTGLNVSLQDVTTFLYLTFSLCNVSIEIFHFLYKTTTKSIFRFVALALLIII